MKSFNAPIRFTHKQEYKASEIEKKWQKKWENAKVYSPNLDRLFDKSPHFAQTPTSLRPASKASRGKQGKPFYNLMMFPYPSAEGMHVGNMYAFTGSDIYGRFKRMQGYDVFEPIGLDGFGIHSENYAIKINKHPKEQAKISQENFYRQLKATGNAFDWSRTLETYDPNYYKWTQWIFIQLFKAGLAYKKKAPVNFCPSDKTVLADEQVIDGKCERCGSNVEKRELEQWFFKITKYAERLLKNTKTLDWSDKVKIAQTNWIGKKEGINIKYQVSGIKYKVSDESEIEELKDKGLIDGEGNLYIECFTTRPDTNFGATFIVLGPEHPLTEKITIKEQKEEVKKYIKWGMSQSDMDRMAQGRKKTGVFTGFYAINNLNGKELPIWVSDFVLGNVGTGAVVGVPGHDMRDFEFAQEFNLPIIRVVVGLDADRSEITKPEQVQEEEGVMVNSEFLDGLDIHVATQKIMDYLEEKGWGKRVTSYHLRDWLISRQRYWGAPIPMVYCSDCAQQGKSWFTVQKTQKARESGQSENQTIRQSDISESPSHRVTESSEMAGWYPVPDNELPVLLPEVKDWKPKGTGESPLASIPEFVKARCPNCGLQAQRETDVSDTFLDSSWYFLRYLATDWKDIPFPMKENSKFEIRNSKQSQNSNNQNSKEIGNWKLPACRQGREIGNYSRRLGWLPVHMYIGGAEHSVLHLLYSRFLTMVFKDLGFIHFEEPFTTFRAHGLLIKEGSKMSKSKGNVVIPDSYIKKFGADVLRSYLMFSGPFMQGGDFHDTGIEGMDKFLKRVYRLFQNSEFRIQNSELGKERLYMMHKTIKKVTGDIKNLRYNTAIAALMEWYNFLSAKRNPSISLRTRAKSEKLSWEEVETYLKLLAPFVPHMTEELWERLKIKDLRLMNKEEKNHKSFESIHNQPWPEYDEKFLKEDEVTIVVQINGRVRDTIRVQSSTLPLRSGRELKVQSEIEKLARESDKIKKYLHGSKIKNIFYIEGKVINFVIA